MLSFSLLTSCTKPTAENGESITEIIEEKNSGPLNEPCITTETLSTWSIILPINGSGSDKIILNNTQALRTMAYFGNVRPLQNEIRCRHSARRVTILKGDNHKSDFQRVGFASQLLIEEEWVVSMYHPTPEYPDNFIVYNINTKEWFRYDHSEEDFVAGTGD